MKLALPNHTNAVAGLLLCVSALASFTRAGTLTTLDGKRYQGSITLDRDAGLIVTPKAGRSEFVELSDVLRADFIADNRRLFRGVVLTSGETIAADVITRLDGSGVRIVRAGGIALVIPATDLAAVFFRPVSADALRHIPAGHAGAVLDNGDFFEGDPAGLDGNQVKISSVLFGIQSFDVSRQARAVIVQDAVIAAANEIVYLVDGSILLGKTASVSDGRLTIDDARLGSTTIEAATIAHMSMGGDAFDTLSHLAPSKVDGGPGYAIDATTAGVPMMLLGAVATHGIGQRPGVSLTWDLDGKYKSVIAKAGVPLGLVPMQRLQFVVLADGKEIFRSAPLSSVDDPALLALSMIEVKTLTLRVDASDPFAPGAAGLWADPILVRNKDMANPR